MSSKFSTRILYGVKAVLVLASRYGEGSLSVSQIAKKEGISVPYLEQILNALKKKGLVKSVRGPQGGYALNQKPSAVSLKNLLDALEEKSFLELSPKTALTVESDEVAVADFIFWNRLKTSVQKGLSEVTLKDLIDEARRFKKTKSSAANFSFHI